MNLQLTSEQQQKLIDLYQSFHPTPNINIQFNPGTIKIKINSCETTVIVPETKTKRKPMSKYIEDAYDAEYELDQTVNNEENFDTLLRFTIDPSKSNGQKIQAYSKVWNQVTQKIKREGETTDQIKRNIWNLIQRNGTRFLRIAQKSNKVTEVVGEFLPRRFEHITPTWLSHIKNEEFEEFLIKLKARYRQEIELLAGARE
ncbi:25473_t:CDS:1 [Dentiscutata erythropus]|uniref:25473_t:CDS:1 n=2 Tax=Diversisporales TaxID=214509 RepID=A0A9N9P3A4_9GLOM|nr:25473_t:CDS:1 [Dentiscutata erythropus]